jgi:hypothetical protein
MNATARRSGVDIRVVLIAAIVLLLALGGAAAWAYTTSGDLDRTRQTLTVTGTDLDATKTSLADTQGKLTKANTDVATEQKAIETDKGRIRGFELQISRKAACIQAQTTNLAEIRRILALERANFDRTTSGSRWNRAQETSRRALDLAISYLAKAYTSAAAGSYSTANSWLSKSNAQVKVSNRQIDLSNKEIAKFNADVAAINKANDAFAETLRKTSTTCGT